MMKLRGGLCVLSFVVSGCARYEFRNELDVPGFCDRPSTSSSLLLRPDGALDPGVVRGRVTDRSSGVSLPAARVWLVSPVRSVAVSSDSTGSFQFTAPPSGRYV